MKSSIVLFNPEIPQNTGNIIRLAANIGADLSLVKPLGFELEDKKLKRAHLYYDEFANINIFENWNECKNFYSDKKFYAIETGSQKSVFHSSFVGDCVFVFGSESSGLPQFVLDDIETLSLPMCSGSRSLNLSNCVSIVMYEVWRQNNFEGSNNINKLNFSFVN